MVQVFNIGKYSKKLIAGKEIIRIFAGIF